MTSAAIRAAAIFERRANSRIDNLLGFLAAAVVFCVFFFFFNPVRPLVFTGAQALASEVKAGDSLEVRWSEHWNRLCAGESTRYMRDASGEIRTIEGITVEIPSSFGDQDRDHAIQIPPRTPHGETQMWTVVTSQCWPWSSQTFVTTSQKISFMVL